MKFELNKSTAVVLVSKVNEKSFDMSGKESTDLLCNRSEVVDVTACGMVMLP